MDEFLEGTARYVNSWAPVFTHLKDQGFVARTGAKRPTRYGAEAHVLAITASGGDELARLQSEEL